MAIETGILRQPRAWLDIGGGQINLLEVEVVQSGSDANSTCEGTLALDDPTSPSAEWWSSEQPIQATVWADNGDGSGSNWLIQATLTKVHIDFGPRVVKFEGEGKGWSDAAQTRTDANYPNQTVMSLIQQFAGMVGLGVVVGGSADGLSQMAGRTYDKQNFNFLTDMENIADGIQQLAAQGGVRAFVHGQNLYLVPPGGNLGSDYLITYEPPGNGEAYDQSNSMKILCTHTMPGVDGATNVTQNVIDKSAYTTAGLDAFGFTDGSGGDGVGTIGGGS